MDISPWLEALEKIPMDLSRAEFIGKLKENNNTVYDHLKTGTLGNWYPEKGKKLTGLLARYRDAEIGKIIDYIGGCPEGISVVAVGGYGRSELSPFSDIDILLMHEEKSGIETFAKDFLYILWDMNYHLGNSTRTVRNVTEHAAKDETFLTSVFEARFLCGDRKLFAEMEKAVKKLVARVRKNYLRNKFEESYGILEGSGNELLLKEPNLKKSPGGLRSVHLMEWLNFAFNGSKSFDGLKKILPPAMYKRLAIAHDFILHVRNMLHFIHRRAEDNLYMDLHLPVAGYLGLKGDDHARMARLMRHYYEKAEDIYLTLLYVLDELDSRMNRAVLVREKKDLPFVCDGRFHVPAGIKPSVSRALDISLEYAREGYGMTYGLVRYLKKSSNMLTENDRYSEVNFSRFRAILETGHAYEALALMKISGLLYRFIPYFSLIRHKVLYNPFHRFTVDQHSIETIGALENLYRGEYDPVRDKKWVHFQDIALKYEGSNWVLKLALLLHDIGKALPGDHSKNGVEMATSYLKKMPMYRSYIQLIQFLIKNHLLLSSTVRRNDISNTEILSDMARELFFTAFPGEYLDFLYLVTYADINATHPKNFTGYLSDMLTHVYERVGGLMKIRERKDYRKNILDVLAAKGVAREMLIGIGDFLDGLGEGYYLTKSEDEVLDDYNSLLSVGVHGHLVKVHLFNDYIKVKFFAPDRMGLFSFLCGILFLNGSDIVKAGIFTFDGIALDEFAITRVNGVEFGEKSKNEQVKMWTADIEKLYRDYSGSGEALEKRIDDYKKNIRRLDKLFSIGKEALLYGPEDIAIDGKESFRLEVSCTDRPALLYDISRYLFRNGADIVNAVIDTTGWYVKDVFGIRITKGTDSEVLKKGLLEVLD